METKNFLDLLKEQGKAKLVTVNNDDSIEKAVKLMLDNEYSQLPIVKKGRVIGVISYESISNILFRHLENKPNPHSKFRAEDLMEKVPHIFTTEEDFLDLLETLANKSYVLVKNGKVLSIITSYDALRFFRTCGEKFLILNDIENILRKIIEKEFDSTFAESAKKIFAYKGEGKAPRTVDSMDFADYITFMCSNWDSFKEFFDDKEDFLRNIKKANMIRNRTCHFRCPIGVDDTDDLRGVLVWFESKVKQE